MSSCSTGSPSAARPPWRRTPGGAWRRAGYPRSAPSSRWTAGSKDSAGYSDMAFRPGSDLRDAVRTPVGQYSAVRGFAAKPAGGSVSGRPRPAPRSSSPCTRRAPGWRHRSRSPGRSGRTGRCQTVGQQEVQRRHTGQLVRRHLPLRRGEPRHIDNSMPRPATTYAATTISGCTGTSRHSGANP